eukprot:514998-Prorocentrum_minimum.AAC.1
MLSSAAQKKEEGGPGRGCLQGTTLAASRSVRRRRSKKGALVGVVYRAQGPKPPVGPQPVAQCGAEEGRKGPWKGWSTGHARPHAQVAAWRTGLRASLRGWLG